LLSLKGGNNLLKPLTKAAKGLCMNYEIEKYWQKIKDGDEKALGIVFKLTYAPLCQYSLHLTHDTFLSQEVVQDTFIKIWQNRNELTITGSFRGYLFQSVHNHALNALRRMKTNRQSVNHPCSEDIWQFVSSHYKVDDDLVEIIFSNETEQLIQKAINELPEKCLRVFQMSRYESLSNSDIARELDVSENTVKTHIYRALRKIAEILKKEN
jgi:RNA polymerase sigma-70 factor (ECF subfamily)